MSLFGAISITPNTAKVSTTPKRGCLKDDPPHFFWIGGGSYDDTRERHTLPGWLARCSLGQKSLGQRPAERFIREFCQGDQAHPETQEQA